LATSPDILEGIKRHQADDWGDVDEQVLPEDY
jgi:hypothetical protein